MMENILLIEGLMINEVILIVMLGIKPSLYKYRTALAARAYNHLKYLRGFYRRGKLLDSFYLGF